MLLEFQQYQCMYSCSRTRHSRHNAETRVLGLLWNTQDDLLKLQERHLSTNRTEGPITKQDVLRESAIMYNPLGILCPGTTLTKFAEPQVTQSGITAPVLTTQLTF
jgi:hypothetical protein